MTDFVWEPSAEYLSAANVTRLMKRLGIDDYHELVARSADDAEWFWTAVVEDLAIEFFTPFEQVLDDSRGPAWPRWFVGGEINLTHNCVDRHAGAHPDSAALLWEGEDDATRSLSYGDLLREVGRVANGLTELGVGPGDVVAVYMPMVPEAIVAMYGAMRIGAIYLPIFSGFGAPAVSARINDSGAKVLFTGDGFFRRGRRVPMKETADAAIARAPSLEHVVVWRRWPDAPCPESELDVSWDDAFARAGASHEPPPLDPETPMMIAYTSGTTGRPKGSVHVHGGFLVKVASEAAYQTDLKRDDVLFWVTDMGWIMGPWEIVGGHAAGASVLLYEGVPNHPRPDRLWSICERHGVTALGISPTLVRALIPAGADRVRAHDLSALRILASTGEPWNPDPYRWLSDVVGRGRCPIINISGGTEVGACFLGQAPVIPTKACSLGTPSLGMAIDVYGEDGSPVRGEVGELVCTRPWPGQTRGFWRAEERYLDTYWSRWPNTWVHGDWASVDSDGYWFLHGRSDDTLNIAGKRIGPAEFESAAVEHPAVSECAAVGVPDDLKGTAVWCFCVPAPDSEPTDELAADVRRVVAEQLGKAFAPAEVRFVAELPKTRSAKILRRAIRARVLGEDPGDLSSMENPDALEAIAQAISS
jgi:acetyl-CoA synthetase